MRRAVLLFLLVIRAAALDAQAPRGSRAVHDGGIRTTPERLAAIERIAGADAAAWFRELARTG